MGFQYWIFYYLVPAIIASYLLYIQSSARNRALSTGALMVLSIVLISHLGVRLSWNFQFSQILLVGTSALLSIYFLGLLGLTYLIASIIQEWCFLLASVLLVPSSGLWLGAIVTALVFTLAHFVHRTEWSHWKWRFPLMFLWAVVSILLYFWLKRPLLNIALHTTTGSILIGNGILYKPFRNGFQK